MTDYNCNLLTITFDFKWFSGDLSGVSTGEIYDFARYGYMHIFEAHFSTTLSILYLFIAKRILRGFQLVPGGFK